jgi:hypothetical protein
MTVGLRIAVEIFGVALVAAVGYVNYWYFANAERLAITREPVVRFGIQTLGMTGLVLCLIVLVVLMFYAR